MNHVKLLTASSTPYARTNVSALEAMWHDGKPSNDVQSAGLIVHQFDAVNPKGQAAFEPCPQHLWCAKYGKIWPSSLINRRQHKGLYRGDQMGGLILAPPPLNSIRCAYPKDGNSMGHIGSMGCQGDCPDCQRPAGYHGPPCKTWDCSFPSERLQQALAAGGGDKHNEIVIDAQVMASNLPHSVLAFFYMQPQTKPQAASHHAEFLKRYNLTADDCPLLHLSASQGLQLER